MDPREFATILLCSLTVLVWAVSVPAAPLNGVWTIEQGSQFVLFEVANVPLASGSDGGVVTGAYQPDEPPTRAEGDTTGSARIVDPAVFDLFGLPAYVSTNEVDPFDGATTYPPPSITDSGDGAITADLSAWDLLWGPGHANQGAPKAAAGNPAPTGTYDATTGAYTLSWTSLFLSGPFSGWVGEWTLVGVGPGTSGDDLDEDGIPDSVDNCLSVPNFRQDDLDGDGKGDLCDCDADGDGFYSETDKGPGVRGHMIVCGGMDCDDFSAQINPAGREQCGNHIDENCDGADFTACNRMVGLFTIEAGSYFNMQGMGAIDILAGADRGFITERYQPDPLPTVPGNDKAESARIADPSRLLLLGRPLSISTNEIDPVDGVTTYPPPSMYDNGDGTVSGSMQGWSVSWNGEHFNQGSPKDNPTGLPDSPAPIGHFNAATGAYFLTWRSLITGGPFDGFTGEWVLVGRVRFACLNDADGDTVCDHADNCVNIPNPNQADCDTDGIGDACDEDADDDGQTAAQGDCDDSCGAENIYLGALDILCNGVDEDCDGLDAVDCGCSDSVGDHDGVNDCADNCVGVFNPGQADCDADGIGNACDDDRDGDGYTAAAGDCDDSCNGRAIHPAAQDIPCNGRDENCDGADEADCSCSDPETDHDGVMDCIDNCPGVFNPDQFDCDADGIGDLCDDASDCSKDSDNDGRVDPKDNCPNVANPDQGDWDGDRTGDLCDDDMDGDGYTRATGDCMGSCGWGHVHPGAVDTPCDGIDQDCSGADATDCNCTDTDSDGVTDCTDNCPDVADPDQADLDRDGTGDVCDTDADGDGVDNITDCDDLNRAVSPGVIEQGASLCADGIDNDCDGMIDTAEDTSCTPCPQGETDGDGACDETDNCPDVANPDQADCDRDGSGDLCDPDCLCCIDSDADGLTDDVDNCPAVSNADQADKDRDGQGDACDSDDDNDGDPDASDCAPMDAAIHAGAEEIPCDGIDQDCSGADAADCRCTDSDSDGVDDCTDNCRDAANPDQADLDGDGIGDPCDDDMDQDGYLNADDCAPMDPAVHPGATESCNDGIDNDCDGLMDIEGGDPDCGPCAAGGTDTDGDRVCDRVDNCIYAPNSDQADCDADGIGDACDDDRDGDGFTVAMGDCDDSCQGRGVGPEAVEIPCNTVDEDCDGWDLIDCSCTDRDLDGVSDCIDNCPDVANSDQADCEKDGRGDACDEDTDGDGYTVSAGDCNDSCGGGKIHPGAGDIPCNGMDEDCDGVDATECGCSDPDHDGLNDCDDNCPKNANPGQQDLDGDGVGDVCDPDADSDGYERFSDCDDFDAAIHPGASEIPCDNIDQNCNGDILDAGPCLAFGDIKANLRAPSRVYQCPGQLKEVTIRIENSDVDSQQATTQTVSWTLKNNDRIMESGTVVLGRGQIVQYKLPWDPAGMPAGSGNLWQFEAVGDGTDPVLSNNIQMRSYELTEGCGPCTDMDGDSICDSVDNCVETQNADQADLDQDGTGNACDPDADGDNHLSPDDCQDLDAAVYPGAPEPECGGNMDYNCDGMIPPDCPGYGDIQINLQAPWVVDNCSSAPESLIITIENKDFAEQSATAQTVTWTLTNNGWPVETWSGTELLDGGQTVQLSLSWNPYGALAGPKNTWELTAVSGGTDPDLTNNTVSISYHVKGRCGIQ